MSCTFQPRSNQITSSHPKKSKKTYIIPNIIRIIRPQLILPRLIAIVKLVRRHRFGTQLDDRAFPSAAHFSIASDRIVGGGRSVFKNRRGA